jgi:hypothetical protein
MHGHSSGNRTSEERCTLWLLLSCAADELALICRWRSPARCDEEDWDLPCSCSRGKGETARKDQRAPIFGDRITREEERAHIAPRNGEAELRLTHQRRWDANANSICCVECAEWCDTARINARSG